MKKADQKPPSAIRAERERKEGKTEGKIAHGYTGPMKILQGTYTQASVGEKNI